MALAFHQQTIMFFKDDRVEVRREEEALKGYWHSGSVLETEVLDSQIRYLIKYDQKNVMVNGKLIRPIPPSIKTRKRDLSYAMCVDVYQCNGWREGAIFDHDHISETRRVFFPDSGDDIMIRIGNMRITQDWNVTLGTWKKRGKWLFLELLDEFENGSSLNLLPVRFWSDLRQKEKFQKLRGWSCDDKELWKALVYETLTDKIKLLKSSLAAVEQDKESDGCPSVKEEVSSNSCGNDTIGRSKSVKRRKQNWLPAGEDRVPGPEFCPNSVIEYLRTKKPEASVCLDVRKHLLYLGWKIEYSEKESFRLRYISPKGEMYYSLRQVCLSLNQLKTKNVCSITRNKSQNQEIAASCKSDLVSAEPEYCPEAAAEWYKYEKTASSSYKGGKSPKELKLRARMHLLSVGWKFKMAVLSNKREMRYLSPHGKVFCSLRTACRDSMEAENGRENKTQRKRKLDSFSKHDKVGKTRSLMELKNELNSRTGTRNRKKRVKQVAVDNISNQKALTVLSWSIDNNVVLPRSKVYLKGKIRTNSRAVGRVTRDGIKCNCCWKVYSLGNFMFHTNGTHCSSGETLFLEDGRSLLECQMAVLHKLMANFVEEPPGNLNDSLKAENEDICSVCHYGGELLMCDQCPSSFHKSCLGLVDVPEGDWFCRSCCCKICGLSRLETDRECLTKDDEFLNCTQCEQKYHIRCVRNKGKTGSKRIQRGNWFCNEKCKEIFCGLGELVGKPILVGPNNLTWTLLKPDSSDCSPSKKASIENCSKLSIAVDILHECFENVEEPYTKRDLLKDVIFNRKSELKRLNFGGFYTVVLQKDDEFVSVATFRVYGNTVAELPLVGTRFRHRRLGMCRILMNVLEKKLVELGVERLILPAVPSLLNAWTGSFGFSKLMVSERLQLIDHIFLDFQDTVMCYKQLMQSPCDKPFSLRVILPRLDDIANVNCDNMSTVNSDMKPETGVDGSVEEKENERGDGLNMETERGFGGLKVYKRRSKKCEISGEGNCNKRTRLECL